MTGFTLTTFGGKAPKTYSRLLPNDMAQVATNCRLDSGRLIPWKGNASVSITPIDSNMTISTSTRTLYRYNSSTWLAYNEDMDIQKSMIAEDQHNRIYQTGFNGTSGYPRITTASIVGAGTYYQLGMPDPPSFAVAPSLSATSLTSTETPVARSYIYTFVSAFGEEGSPSQALESHILNVFSDQTATITFPSVPSGSFNISKRRLYRTDTTGTFRRVAEINVGTSTHADNLTDSQLGEAIPTNDFIAPPDSSHTDGAMLGLTALPNGIFCGFSGNTVLFSEAFLPHAYPEKFRLTMQSDVVALTPIPSGLLVLTKGKPAIVQGSSPSSMQMREIDSPHSCVSKRSVVDMGDYSMYASPDGLVMASDQGLRLITEQVFTRDQWQSLVPTTIHAYFWEGFYVGFYNDGSGKGFIFDPRGGKNQFIDLDFYASAGFSDLETDELYLVIGGSVYKFASGNSLSFTWRSKEFYNPRPINLGVAKVECDDYASASIQFKLFADGSLKHTQNVSSVNDFRLPSGYTANRFEIELSGSKAINLVQAYETVEEVGLDGQG